MNFLGLFCCLFLWNGLIKPNFCFSVPDISIDEDEEDEEQIIERRRKQREELLKVSLLSSCSLYFYFV